MKILNKLVKNIFKSDIGYIWLEGWRLALPDMKKLSLIVSLFVFLAACKEQPHADTEHTTPATAAGSLTHLLEGNGRFTSFKPIHPDESRERRKEVSEGQHPEAVVVTCSDSRVPPELVFDQGLGDLFVIRTAGNIMGDIELGSIEYAVEHLNVPLVVVMGHERCGAIQAYFEGGAPHGHIKALVDSIASEEEIKILRKTGDDLLDHFVRANVHHGVKQLIESSAIIREKMEAGTLKVVGAYEDLDNGKVSILNGN